MDQRPVPYVDALREHAERDPARLYVPGHKGGPGADPALVDAAGPRALEMDIPALIPGIDVGPEPTPFGLAQQLAADAWGAKRSWFLLNGASQGNHAACLALRHSGRRLVVQRNAHSSVIDGAVLAGLEPTFVAPELDPDLGVAHCVTADALAAALDATPDAVGAICVSPTYFGACADVAALAEVAHSRGVPLVMDEAWGAHLRFSPELPASALESGADLVISSTHKIVGSLTQSAIVHLGHTESDRRERGRPGGHAARVDEPERAAHPVARRRPAPGRDPGRGASGGDAGNSARRPRADPRDRGARRARRAPRSARASAGWDPLRLTVDVRAAGITGQRCAALLRENADVYCELATETVIIGAFGMGGEAAPLADRFVSGLQHVVADLGEQDPEHGVPFAVPPPWGPMEMVPRDAFLGPQEAVPIAAAAGRIASESLAAYPPGVPNVLPGERLTRETIDFIADTLEHGGYLRGASDRTLETIRVVIE